MMDGVYGFDTEDRDRATAALLVYAIYRSRNRARFKITPDVWDRITRLTRSAAERSGTLPRFIERLAPKMACESLHPRAMAVGIRGSVPLIESGHGELIQLGGDGEQREFLTRVLDRCDERRTLSLLRTEAQFIVLLVRDRLGREKPIERRFETILDAEAS